MGEGVIEDMRWPVAVEMGVLGIGRYARSEFRYASKLDEVAIENAVREMGRMEETNKRFLGMKDV